MRTHRESFDVQKFFRVSPFDTERSRHSYGTIFIDRPRGSVRPRYADRIYPSHYGYLVDTSSNDGDGIDVWIGSLAEKTLTGMIYTVDGVKGDMEVKLLLGCTSEDMHTENGRR